MTEKDAGGETLAQGIPQERGEDQWVPTPWFGSWKDFTWRFRSNDVRA